MGKVSAPSCTELLKGALEGGASCMKLKKQASNNSLDICPLLVIQDNTKRNCVAKNFTKILLPSLVELLVELKKKITIIIILQLQVKQSCTTQDLILEALLLWNRIHTKDLWLSYVYVTKKKHPRRGRRSSRNR
jgi:hypothetical protein